MVVYRATRRLLVLAIGTLGSFLLFLQFLAWTAPNTRPGPIAQPYNEFSTVDTALANQPADLLLSNVQASLADSVARFNKRYAWDHFKINSTRYNMEEYVHGLEDVWAEFFAPNSAWGANHAEHADPRFAQIMDRLSFFPKQQHKITQTVWTTSKENNSTMHDYFNSWTTMNPGWTKEWWTDDDIDAWLIKEFGANSGITQEMIYMRNGWGILRADLFRYLILLFRGGVYTDTDTECMRPLHTWGTEAIRRFLNPAMATLSRVRRPSFDRENIQISKEWQDPDPSLIVALENDCDGLPTWDTHGSGYPRCSQIVQWTIYARPFHPVLLDVTLNGLRTSRRIRQAEERGEPLYGPDIMEWFGPGAFSDSIFRYLLVRHGIHPHDIESFAVPLRFGDITFLPTRSFDFPKDPEEAKTAAPWKTVKHNFEGLSNDGWKIRHDKKDPLWIYVSSPVSWLHRQFIIWFVRPLQASRRRQ